MHFPINHRISAIVCTLLLGGFTTSSADAAGMPLPVRPEIPMMDGSVSHSCIARDGAVFIAGGFHEIDGIPRPGLAKLTPDGRLDRRFLPETVPGTPRLGDWVTIPAFHAIEAQPLFLTSRGTLLHATYGRMLAYRVNGTRDRRFDRLHIEGTNLVPVAEHSGLLYLARSKADSQWLEAYDAETLEPFPLSGQDAWPESFLTAAPAAAGKLWVVGGRVGFFGTPPQSVFRILRNGELDPAFTPLALPAGYSASITTQPDGGFRLVSQNIDRFLYWPGPTTQTYQIKWFSPDGEELRSENFIVSVGYRFVAADEPDGSLIHNITPGPHEPGIEEHSLVRLRPDGSRDPGFHVPINAPSLHRLPDGRLHYDHLHRVFPDATPDPSWRAPHVSVAPAVRIIGRLPDGSTLTTVHPSNAALGAISFPISSTSLLLLDSRLRRDHRFRPPADLPLIGDVGISEKGAVVLSLAGDFTLPDGSPTRLLLLRRDGSVDADSPRFRPPSSAVSIGPDGKLIPGPPSGFFAVHPLPDGAFLIDHVNLGGEVMQRSIWRINPDGSRDPGFSTIWNLGFAPVLLVLADGDFMVGGVHYSSDGNELQTVPLNGNHQALAQLPSGHILFQHQKDFFTAGLVKWHPTSGLDPAFDPAFLENTSINGAVPVTGGKLIVTGYRLLTRSGESRILRLHADGRIDPAFRGPDPRSVLPRTMGLRFIARGGEFLPATWRNRAEHANISSLLYDFQRNRLLVAGDFTHLNRTSRPGLAALGLGRPRNFREWALESLPEPLREPDADADHDGATNLHEYAVGSDPAISDDPPRLQVLPGTPQSFRLALDPEAIGVEAILEFSTDLRHWSTVDESVATAKTETGHITWHFREARPAAFARVRFIESPARRAAPASRPVVP